MKRKLWALLTVLALLGAACGGEDADTTTGEGGSEPRGYRFVVVSHGQSSDPFWSVAANGVQAAASDMGVTVEYQAPGTFDMVEMSNLIDAAVASNPDGIVVTIPDADALGASIRAAIEAGIPVISMNSGSDVFQDLGVLVHVGQTEYEAGLGAGQRMAAAGVTNAICVNQEVGNVALDLRCEGFADGLGGNVEVIPVDLADPAGTQATVGNALSAGADIDGLLTLGPTGATPAMAALQEADLLGEIEFGTFDLSPEVLEAIDAGDMSFAIDQQQYLQGYLPIVFLTQFKETLALPGGGGVILTGPGFVTQETASDVVELSREGLR